MSCGCGREGQCCSNEELKPCKVCGDPTEFEVCSYCARKKLAEDNKKERGI